MSSYLIPKSARNVKLQLFRGLGMTEVMFLLGGVGLGLLIFRTTWHIIIQAVIVFILLILVTFLISPSFISNKKGYETFKIMFAYFSSYKYYSRRMSKKKK